MADNAVKAGDVGGMFDREQKKDNTPPLSKINEPAGEPPVSPEPGSEESRDIKS